MLLLLWENLFYFVLPQAPKVAKTANILCSWVLGCGLSLQMINAFLRSPDEGTVNKVCVLPLGMRQKQRQRISFLKAS